MSRSQMWRSLLLLYSSGVGLDRAFHLLERQAGEPRLRLALSTVHGRLLTGWSLCAALRESGAFSEVEVQLVRLGEQTGTLAQGLECLAAWQERQTALTRQVRSALVYPAFLLVVCLLLACLLPALLFGPVLAFLSQSSLQLPWSTRLVLGMSRHPWVLGLLMAALLEGGRRIWRRDPEGWLLRLPMLNQGWRTLTASRFAGGLEAAVRSGAPLLLGLELAAGCSGSPCLREQVGLACRAMAEKGRNPGRAMREVAMLPPVVTRCFQVGLETGRLDSLLGNVRRLLEEDLTSWLDRFTASLEPAVMLGAGLLVGLTVHATVSPMLEMLKGLSL